jgi:hypothetical protein
VSSHREAPEISKDPVADNTDLYAFVSPDKPDTVTIISNYLPGEAPAGGPNFYEFGEDVLYSIYIDNNGDGKPDITYNFQFNTVIGNPDTFLYATSPITDIGDSAWNRKQFYSVQRIGGKPGPPGPPPPPPGPPGGGMIATNLACPPCNIGPFSTPNYAHLAGQAVYNLPSGETVFAGQRVDGFYVDLGSIFDLGDLRPLEAAFRFASQNTGTVNTNGVNSLKNANVHTIALQVPIKMLTRDGKKPTSASSPNAVIGVWAGASRRNVEMHDGPARAWSGPWTQVSRLGNPLVNEVVIPMSRKDEWNAKNPNQDSDFLEYFQHPELSGLLNVLYPGAFPNLAALSASSAVRDDLIAVLLTGINGLNFTGNTIADMLRLNVGIGPSSNPKPLGVVAGDNAGYPNGRRVFDDVVTIELQAFAGLTYKLFHSSYALDGVVPAVNDGLDASRVGGPYLQQFPYLGLPLDGYDHPSS